MNNEQKPVIMVYSIKPEFDDYNLQILMRRQETEFRIEKNKLENNKPKKRVK